MKLFDVGVRMTGYFKEQGVILLMKQLGSKGFSIASDDDKHSIVFRVEAFCKDSVFDLVNEVLTGNHFFIKKLNIMNVSNDRLFLSYVEDVDVIRNNLEV